MNLQNGYKIIYEEIVDGKRTFFADKLDGTAADQINATPFTVGEYKLVFEKDGGIFGSTTGKVEDGERIDAFDKVFCCEHVDEDENSVCDVCEEEVPAQQEPEANGEEEPKSNEGNESGEEDLGEEEPGESEDETEE